MPTTRRVHPDRAFRFWIPQVLWVALGCNPTLNAPADALVPAAERNRTRPTWTGPSSKNRARTKLGETVSNESQQDADPEWVEDEAPADPESSHRESPKVFQATPHPLDGWTPEQMMDAVQNDIQRLGSLSIGAPSAGALLNGVRADASPLFEPVHPEGAWGTVETLTYLTAAVESVHRLFPDTPPLLLGDISDRDGGPLRPHLSHQSGRDLDISFYYLNGARWYARATRANLDLPRTWAFVRALVTETDVEMILVDSSIQWLLRKHAVESGENEEWVNSLFAGSSGSLRPILRHAPGHATHLHIRFYNPIAQEAARRCHALLVQEGKVQLPPNFLHHRARRGETLGRLAKRYRVSVESIKAANRLRSNRIWEKRTYLIPTRATSIERQNRPLYFPTRRLPESALPAD